jgi:hypothetical protein
VAITVRTPATANNGAVTTSSLTVGYPSGSADGDLIVQAVNAQSSATAVPSAVGAAGLTAIDTQQGANNTAQLYAWQAAITATDIAGTSPGFTITANRLMAGIVLGMSGAAYESITNGTQANAATATAPSVTPSTDNSLLVMMVATVFSTANTAYTVSTPAGWTASGSTHTTNTASRTGLDFFTKQLGAGTGGAATGTTALATAGSVIVRWMTAVVVAAPTVAAAIPNLVMAPMTGA